ncbi:MAG: signal peptidase I [Chloroflexota bacterium]
MDLFKTKNSKQTTVSNTESQPAASQPLDDSAAVEAARQRTSRPLWFVFIKELTQIIVPAFILAIIVYTFLAQATVVYGQSMEPTLLQNQRLVVDKLSYRFQQPLRGDIIVIRLPGMNEMLVKRVIGLPGEVVEIQDGSVYIDGQVLDEAQLFDVMTLPTDGENSDQTTKVDPELYGTGMGGILENLPPLTIETEHYFVMGDNRRNSNDSRTFGAVSREHVLGRVWFRYWPLTQFDSF